MHPYLTHLLADIKAAHREEIPYEPSPPVSFEEEMEEIENWLEGDEALHSFGYYCGLESVNFPPAEQLTDAEMQTVLTAFKQLMFTWNQGIDLPGNLPVAIAYKMTVDTLDAKTSIVNSGFMSFDFCSGYAPDCVFKEYCPCLEIWNTTDDDKEVKSEEDYNDDLPF